MKFIKKKDPETEEGVEEGSPDSPEIDLDKDFGADIESGADTLLGFLEEKTKFSVSEIAEDLGVPEKTIKVWAKALEKSGYVDIKYSAIKGMVLEYAADKPYRELNVGRSELPTDLDEIEIEVEDANLIEEQSGAVKETEHIEEEVEDESVEESEEETSRKEDVSEQEVKETDNEDSSGKTSEKSSDGEEPDISEEKGKEKLKEELDELQGGKGDQDDNKEKKEGKIHAKEAKIREEGSKVKKKVKETSKSNDSEYNSESNSSEAKESLKQAIDELQEGKSGGSATALSSKGGEDLEGENDDRDLDLRGHGERMLEMSKKLIDPEVRNDPVYEKLNGEMIELKEFAVDRSIDESRKEDIVYVLDRLETYINNEQEPEPDSQVSGLGSFISRVKDILDRLKSSIIDSLPIDKKENRGE